MPAKTITVSSKSKDGLKKTADKKLKEFASQGMRYVTRNYSPGRVKKVKGGYEIELSVHS